MNNFAEIVRDYARKYRSGRVITKTSITRDLILIGKDNDFIRKVVLEIFGEWWENRQINRVRKKVKLMVAKP